MPFVMRLKEQEYKQCRAEHRCPLVAPPLQDIPCTDGKADEYECNNVDLLSFVPLRELGSNGNGNDIWGWTDPKTDREYAIVGCEDGTSFVDVTDPTDPKVLGFLPTHTFSSSWRDMKVRNSNYTLNVFFLQEDTEVANRSLTNRNTCPLGTDVHYP